MAEITVILTDELKAWVDAQIGTGRYMDASDYIRDLIRHDQDRQSYAGEAMEPFEDALGDYLDPPFGPGGYGR